MDEREELTEEEKGVDKYTSCLYTVQHTGTGNRRRRPTGNQEFSGDVGRDRFKYSDKKKSW